MNPLGLEPQGSIRAKCGTICLSQPKYHLQDHGGHMFHPGRYTHTHRVVEAGFITQRTGRGHCPAACLHAHSQFYPSSLHFPLLILSLCTLIPLFLHPGLSCLFADKQPHYLFFTGFDFVTAIPKYKTSDVAT